MFRKKTNKVRTRLIDLGQLMRSISSNRKMISSSLPKIALKSATSHTQNTCLIITTMAISFSWQGDLLSESSKAFWLADPLYSRI